MVFVQLFFTAIIQITFGIFIILSTKIGLFDFINYFMQFTSLTFELFFPFYFGQQLFAEGEYFLNSLYECDWTDQSEIFKKNLLISITRAQKIPILKAGNMVPLTLETFLQVGFCLFKKILIYCYNFSGSKVELLFL